MPLLILVTGGTFDKVYCELDEQLELRKTHVPDMLKLGRNRKKLRIRTLMMKDSLLMTNKDRKKILGAVLKAEEKKIVITHGTGTMAETARFLGPKVRGKTVVLTGAMIPFTLGSSDGLFNLGSAIAFAQTLPNGVYIAMNGRHFNWDNVRKDVGKGVFETLKKGRNQ